MQTTENAQSSKPKLAHEVTPLYVIPVLHNLKIGLLFMNILRNNSEMQWFCSHRSLTHLGLVPSQPSMLASHEVKSPRKTHILLSFLIFNLFTRETVESQLLIHQRAKTGPRTNFQN